MVMVKIIIDTERLSGKISGLDNKPLKGLDITKALIIISELVNNLDDSIIIANEVKNGKN